MPRATLMDIVWFDTIVEDASFRLQVAAVRKALGSAGDLIKTVPGRGYLLAGPNPPNLVGGWDANSDKRTFTFVEP
ncbi:winged helix-turn-helix domain-containing protein [Sphingomonas sp. BN140010]|uniref:Winged helix-turn-helix domain-containing protein n=1 Tax=Sphingomonas arvum TaxID=2992113 RepID=A0ABT3JDM6_9SPHN|nr:winged helix-turn-helix domain-containing protein [Sphingomonas sp. BN140010]MCW3797190.1 winged helix-turn-helix domain-containing protein [Sphingomonas sp. BN140010]